MTLYHSHDLPPRHSHTLTYRHTLLTVPYACVGDAAAKAAETASDSTDKALDQVHSVADPASVGEALDSVGDAVENAVPDPKDAPSGLAPTTNVSTAAVDSSSSEKESQGRSAAAAALSWLTSLQLCDLLVCPHIVIENLFR